MTKQIIMKKKLWIFLNYFNFKEKKNREVGLF